MLKGHPQRGDTTRVLPVCLLASGVGSYAYSRRAVLQLGHHLQPCIDVWSGDRVFECGRPGDTGARPRGLLVLRVRRCADHAVAWPPCTAAELRIRGSGLLYTYTAVLTYSYLAGYRRRGTGQDTKGPPLK